MDGFFLYVLFRDIVLFIWRIAKMLRLHIPLVYVVVASTIFYDISHKYENLTVAIFIIMLIAVALSWIYTFITKVKIIADSINNKM